MQSFDSHQTILFNAQKDLFENINIDDILSLREIKLYQVLWYYAKKKKKKKKKWNEYPPPSRLPAKLPKIQ